MATKIHEVLICREDVLESANGRLFDLTCRKTWWSFVGIDRILAKFPVTPMQSIRPSPRRAASSAVALPLGSPPSAESALTQSRRTFLKWAAGGTVALIGGARASSRAADLPGTSPDERALAYYALPAAMSRGGAHASVLAGSSANIHEWVAHIQNVLLHEHWAFAYGVKLSDERRRESHVRPVETILDGIFRADARAVTESRSLDTRLVGTCRHFALLLVAALRAHGIPARARCGFAGYFGTGAFEDHWVGEYWNADRRRWQLVDAQIDALQRSKLHLDFDLLDVPRDRFVVAGDAWLRCRRGEADAASYGMSPLGLSGLWFIASNVVRDLAALNKVEMLPWDVWGAMQPPDKSMDAESLALFDRVSSITAAPDQHFAELRDLYQSDRRFTVPATVYNAIHQQHESVGLSSSE
jgi:hypothetical protein